MCAKSSTILPTFILAHDPGARDSLGRAVSSVCDIWWDEDDLTSLTGSVASGSLECSGLSADMTLQVLSIGHSGDYC